MKIVSANMLAIIILLIAALVQGYLMVELLSESVNGFSRLVWLGLHLVSSVAIALAVAMVAKQMQLGSVVGAGILSLAIAIAIPLVGGVGFALAFLVGAGFANARNEEDVYWKVTDNIDLPFTTPIGRKVAKYDSRGFVEQLMYSEDNDDLYRKVLAATNIRAALSVGLLKRAVRHPDDKIRLTAYQTLDRKVTGLNREIQRLEDRANDEQGSDKANTWLQIAGNYWELITLEKEEPIARKQLVGKAAGAAVKALEIQPDNRNAHFTLGRALLMQDKPAEAEASFKQAELLGMPREKIMPYMAEAAYDQREFKKVAEYLGSIDDAFKIYPPLKHVAGYWR